MRDRHAGQRARFALRNAGIGGFCLTERLLGTDVEEGVQILMGFNAVKILLRNLNGRNLFVLKLCRQFGDRAVRNIHHLDLTTPRTEEQGTCCRMFRGHSQTLFHEYPFP